MLRTAREECGLTTYDLAAVQCCPRTRVHEWEDPDGHRAHTPLDLALDPTIGPTLLRLIAEHHGLEITKAPTDLQSAASHLHSLAAVIKEHSDVVLTLSAALADQKLSAAEQERIARECTEAIAALTELRSRMQGASVRTLRIAEER